ncbi:MAG: SpoIID/LytB domain-containing protein [Christensenellales bacterium]
MKRGWLIFSCAACLCLSGCAAGSGGGDKPALPQPEPDGGQGAGQSAAQPAGAAENESGVPMLTVYDVKNEKLETCPSKIICPPCWPERWRATGRWRRLKAQAILARTFVLQFVSQRNPCDDGADISTDIKEAQAYDAAGVNARIREAVKETRGEVLNAGGELPYAWFHAHSGGLTARAKRAGLRKAEPGYTQCVKGMENDEAPGEAASGVAGQLLHG